MPPFHHLSLSLHSFSILHWMSLSASEFLSYIVGDFTFTPFVHQDQQATTTPDSNESTTFSPSKVVAVELPASPSLRGGVRQGTEGKDQWSTGLSIDVHDSLAPNTPTKVSLLRARRESMGVDDDRGAAFSVRTARSKGRSSRALKKKQQYSRTALVSLCSKP